MKFTALKWIVVMGLAAGFGVPVPAAHCADTGAMHKVLIVTPVLYGPADQDYLRRGLVDMLSTRLADPGKVAIVEADAASIPAGRISPTQAAQLAAGAGADFAVFGSITLLGQQISTDLRMVRAASGDTAVSFSRSGSDAAALIEHADRFAAQVNRDVFLRAARVPAPAASAPAAPAAGANVGDIHQHPEKLLQQSYGFGADDRGGAGLIGAGSAIRGPRLADQVHAVATGDLDGDGRKEIVLTGSGAVSVYRFIDGRFVKMAVVEGTGSYIGVDTADVNANGKDEIFVTNYDQNAGQVLSFVLEYDGSSFQRTADRLNYYFRAVRLPDRGRVIFGQRQGLDDLFIPGIYEMVWEAGAYDRGQRLKAPRDMDIFGFAIGRMPPAEGEMIFSYDSYGRIRVTDRTGKEEWVGTEGYGSVAAVLTFPSKDDPRQQDRRYVDGRIDMVDLDGDGVDEIVAIRNEDLSGSMLSRLRVFKHGRVEILKTDQLGLATRWRTRNLPKYISDFCVADFDGDGQMEMVVVVVQKGRSVLGPGRSHVYVFTLDLPAAGAQ